MGVPAQIQGYGTLKSGLWDAAVGPGSCPAAEEMGHFERQCQKQCCVIPGEGADVGGCGCSGSSVCPLKKLLNPAELCQEEITK